MAALRSIRERFHHSALKRRHISETRDTIVCSAEPLLVICQALASLIDLRRDRWEMNPAVTWVGCVNKGGCHGFRLLSVVGVIVALRIGQLFHTFAEISGMLSRVLLKGPFDGHLTVVQPFCSSQLMFSPVGELREGFVHLVSFHVRLEIAASQRVGHLANMLPLRCCCRPKHLRGKSADKSVCGSGCSDKSPPMRTRAFQVKGDVYTSIFLGW